MNQEAPLILHTIYPTLEGKNLLVIETKATSHRIDEEARGLQKMNVTNSESALVIHNQRVSLKQFVTQKNFDFLVVNPYINILPDIQSLIDTQHHIILLTSSQSVDETCNDAIKKWQESGIPTISKDNLDYLPQTLMQTMGAMIQK